MCATVVMPNVVLGGGVMVDCDQRFVLRGVERVNLTPKETLLMSVVLHEYPDAVAHNRMRIALWGGGIEPQNTTRTVDVMCCELNRKMHCIGLSVMICSVSDLQASRKLVIDPQSKFDETPETILRRLRADLAKIEAESKACAQCPECGTVLIPDRVEKRGITVDLRTNTVSRENRCRQLTRMQAVLLSVLLQAYPSTVSHERLFAVLWPDPDCSPYDLMRLIRVHSTRLNKLIRCLDLRTRGRGNGSGGGSQRELIMLSV